MSDASRVAYWQQRQVEVKKRNQGLAKQARQDARQIAAFLAKHYGVQKVVLFGSLATGPFTADSDIDLAVAGLPVADFFQAYGELMALSDFIIDLKPLEKVDPHFYQRVMTQGEVIYEAIHSG